MSFSPTPEQLAIVEAAQSTTDNLIITALAGAAKTTTLRLIAEALPKTPILCLAFNKKIATEMQERLPPNTKAMTLNGLGHRAWMSRGKRLTLDTEKTMRLIKAEMSSLTSADQGEVWASMSEILQCLRWMKVDGAIPPGVEGGRPLVSLDLFFDLYDDVFEPWAQDFMARVLTASINEALNGIIDFDDQIYMPTLWPAAFDPYPLVLVDESQDLSAINHAMLKKIVKKRLIAVGDPNQSIYGFRGAEANSMSKLRNTFNMTELSLTTSFRCPRSVVREARWRAPKMLYPDWAVEGEVRTLPTWTEADIPDDAAVLCRNNAPLFSAAIKLLRAKRLPQLSQVDIGKKLVKIMGKLGPKSLPTADALLALETWAEAEKKKVKSPGRVYDQSECIAIFLHETETLGDAIAFLESVLARPGSIKLLTVHKSKGLEFDDVFILDRRLIHLDDDQDRNLLYVAQTRAKSRLTYITLEGYVDATAA